MTELISQATFSQMDRWFSYLTSDIILGLIILYKVLYYKKIYKELKEKFKEVEEQSTGASINHRSSLNIIKKKSFKILFLSEI